MNGGRRHINDTDSIATERAVNNQEKKEREREGERRRSRSMCWPLCVARAFEFRINCHDSKCDQTREQGDRRLMMGTERQRRRIRVQTCYVGCPSAHSAHATRLYTPGRLQATRHQHYDSMPFNTVYETLPSNAIFSYRFVRRCAFSHSLSDDQQSSQEHV